MKRVVVVPHDPSWKDRFAVESRVIEAVFGNQTKGIHHIGSTSVPGIFAKPIVDILLEVSDLYEVDGYNDAMEALGYECMGEHGIEGRRYFRKNNAKGERIYHIHAFSVGSLEAMRHLAFRDYLRAHAEVAQAYGELKVRLAREHPTDMGAYMDGKDPFIKRVQENAVVWYEQRESDAPPGSSPLLIL